MGVSRLVSHFLYLAWIAHLATCQIHYGVTRFATIPGAG
jgi:hypothetical protein